jgi:hypothetical protein
LSKPELTKSCRADKEEKGQTEVVAKHLLGNINHIYRHNFTSDFAFVSPDINLPPTRLFIYLFIYLFLWTAMSCGRRSAKEEHPFLNKHSIYKHLILQNTIMYALFQAKQKFSRSEGNSSV